MTASRGWIDFSSRRRDRRQKHRVTLSRGPLAPPNRGRVAANDRLTSPTTTEPHAGYAASSGRCSTAAELCVAITKAPAMPHPASAIRNPHSPTRITHCSAPPASPVTPLSGWFGGRSPPAPPTDSRRTRAQVVHPAVDGRRPSHTDTFDPKPEAPASIRGELEGDRHVRAGHPDQRETSRKLAAADAARRHPARHVHRAKPTTAAPASTCTPATGRARRRDLPRPRLDRLGRAGRPDSPLPNFVVTGTPLEQIRRRCATPATAGRAISRWCSPTRARGLENLQAGRRRRTTSTAALGSAGRAGAGVRPRLPRGRACPRRIRPASPGACD